MSVEELTLEQKHLHFFRSTLSYVNCPFIEGAVFIVLGCLAGVLFGEPFIRMESR